MFEDLDSVISLTFLTRFDCQNRADWLTPKRLGAWLKSVRYTGRTDPAILHARRGAAPRGATGQQGARGPWNSTHNGQPYQGTYDAFEQQVTVAEQLAWVHTFSDGITRDSGDVLIELMEFAIQWREANGLPTTAK